MACVGAADVRPRDGGKGAHLPGVVARDRGTCWREVGLKDEEIIIRMTGCPNGCVRPYLAEIGLVGKGPGRYNLYLGAAYDGSRLDELYGEDLEALLKEHVLGLVPTMGALHEGHISLIREAQRQCSPVAVSIFVNPKQFGPSEDFKKYPRTFEADRELLEKLGVNYLFAPSPEEVYPQDFRTGCWSKA